MIAQPCPPCTHVITAPGSAADARLLAALDELGGMAPDGSVTLPTGPALAVGIVLWEPAGFV